MASAQCVRNEEISVQLSVEEKATVDEIMKQAEFSLESQELLDQSIGVVAENESLDKAATATKIQVLKGVLKNQTRGPLTVMATKIWGGHIVKNFPNSFTGIGHFIMAGMSNKVIKAAVVYSGKNKVGVECAWLLAFASRNNATGWSERVYAECGPKTKFNNINWAEVERKLDKAGTVAKAIGTSVYATIHRGVVVAVFCG